MVINDGQARRIAAEWHGGQASALCALATSGAIDLDCVRTEISRELFTLDVGTDRRELLALDKYVRRAGGRSQQARWTSLWDESPIVLDHC